MVDAGTELTGKASAEDWPMAESTPFAVPWEPNKDSEVKDKLPNM